MTRQAGDLPRARRRGLMVTRLQDETLVYDFKRARVFCLDRRLARLWRWSNGKTSIAAITARARAAFAVDAELVDESLVTGALDRLRRARLLEPQENEESLSSADRRTFLRRAAVIGGLALVQVAAPKDANAQSCISSAACRTLFGPCAGGLPCCGTALSCRTPGAGRCSCR